MTSAPSSHHRSEHILVAAQAGVLGLAGEFAAAHDGAVVLRMTGAAGRRTLSLFEALSATIVQLRHCTVDTTTSRAQRCLAFHRQLLRVLQDQDHFVVVPPLTGQSGGKRSGFTTGAADAVRHALAKARDFHAPAVQAAVAFLEGQPRASAGGSYNASASASSAAAAAAVATTVTTTTTTTTTTPLAPPPPWQEALYFPGFLTDKLPADAHSVAGYLDSAFGPLHTCVIRPGRSGDVLRV